ncbi:UPF0271 protein [Actinidia chinensis var. chinensis]|uniref:UPF0271 protein n=1 Tax=Actinidia chinensis var. chinensis TaxID=1590841 RepID=A0A2R6QHD1_ACTCC|nr:UPF0271 protein [Actinidia chinensis var. chinensis]
MESHYLLGGNGRAAKILQSNSIDHPPCARWSSHVSANVGCTMQLRQAEYFSKNAATSKGAATWGCGKAVAGVATKQQGRDLGWAIASEQARSTYAGVRFTFDGTLALLGQWSPPSCRDLRARRPSVPELDAVANKGTIRAKAFVISKVPLVSKLGTITVLETWTKDDRRHDFQGMSGDRR